MSKRIRVRPYVLIAGFLGLLLACLSLFPTNVPAQMLSASEQLQVTEYILDTGPLFVRSAIIEGPTEIGLVDTQFTKSNAHRLVADLIEKGKELKWVYITHPHLDHFNGAEIIHQAFPAALFYGQPEALDELPFMVETRQASLGAAAPGGIANLPDQAPVFVEAIPSKTLTVDGRSVQIVPGVGDHPKSSFVWVEDAKTVIMGDITFGDTHAFIGDHRDFEGWIATLDDARALEPETVIVGHAAPDARYGAEALDAQVAWIEDVESAVAQEDSPEAVEAAMVAKYPGYANDFIFQFSYDVKRFSE